MWYTYKFACGHGEKQIQLNREIDANNRKLAWYARTRVCPDCYKKQKEKEKEEKEMSINYGKKEDNMRDNEKTRIKRIKKEIAIGIIFFFLLIATLLLVTWITTKANIEVQETNISQRSTIKN